MAVIKPLYGTNNQIITITLASLGNNVQKASSAIDNTSNLFRDVLLMVKIKTGASGAVAASCINIYVFGTADGGTTYSDNIAAAGTVTLTSPPNMTLVDTIACPANSTTYVSKLVSIAWAFGGVLPDHWGIVVENKFGGTLDATAGNFAAWYQGINDQAV